MADYCEVPACIIMLTCVLEGVHVAGSNASSTYTAHSSASPCLDMTPTRAASYRCCSTLYSGSQQGIRSFCSFCGTACGKSLVGVELEAAALALMTLTGAVAATAVADGLAVQHCELYHSVMLLMVQQLRFKMRATECSMIEPAALAAHLTARFCSTNVGNMQSASSDFSKTERTTAEAVILQDVE
eukprot:906-Heterococcus_DN1.PRE.2